MGGAVEALIRQIRSSLKLSLTRWRGGCRVSEMKIEMALSSLAPGEFATIASMGRESTEQLRLMEMGLLPGTEIRFIRQAPMGDPLEIEVKGYNLSLRRSEAAAIVVNKN